MSGVLAAGTPSRPVWVQGAVDRAELRDNPDLRFRRSDRQMPSKGPPKRPGKTASSGACRVLRDGREAVFDSLEALALEVRAGRVDADCRVKVPGTSGWQRLSDVPELAAELAVDDPWAAWDAMEDGLTEDPPTDPGEEPSQSLPSLPPDALVESPTEDTPIAELPTEAVRVLPTGTKKKKRFVIEGPKKSARKPATHRPLPPRPAPESPEPRPTAAVASAPPEPTPRPSNVIAFPSPLGPSTLGPHALAPLNAEPLMELPALQVKPKPEPRSGPRWGMLVLVGFVAFGLVGAVNAWVRHVASQTFAPRPPPEAVAAAPNPTPAPAPASVEPPPAPVADGAVDELTALDQELRGRMRTDLGAVKEEGDLESALYVDLSRMGLSDLKVDAVVTAWGGKKRDVPQSAEIQVGFRSQPGELDRELAAVGLIVGRYIQSYELDMARFEVLLDTGESGVRRWPIDPAQARNYYIRRSDLPTFLTNMRSAGGR